MILFAFLRPVPDTSASDEPTSWAHSQRVAFSGAARTTSEWSFRHYETKERSISERIYKIKTRMKGRRAEDVTTLSRSFLPTACRVALVPVCPCKVLLFPRMIAGRADFYAAIFVNWSMLAFRAAKSAVIAWRPLLLTV